MAAFHLNIMSLFLHISSYHFYRSNGVSDLDVWWYVFIDLKSISWSYYFYVLVDFQGFLLQLKLKYLISSFALHERTYRLDGAFCVSNLEVRRLSFAFKVSYLTVLVIFLYSLTSEVDFQGNWLKYDFCTGASR